MRWVLSAATRVMRAVPLRFKAGVTLIVRLAPVPANCMLLTGTKVRLLLVAVIVITVNGESGSTRENGTSPVFVSSAMLMSCRPTIPTGSFTAVTATLKLRLTWLFSACPSSTVTVITAEPLALAMGL